VKLRKTERYASKERKFFKKHPDLISKYGDVLEKLSFNIFEPSLKLHQLKGNLFDYHAVSLTYEYRIVLMVQIVEDEIILFNIGTHDDVY
jgi:mRNA-degrading endonuclease YafQ of YafQ-DinJ toxin-antitoxin module